MNISMEMWLERILAGMLRRRWHTYDDSTHRGVLYRAANFKLIRTNERGLQTYMRPLRGLQPHEHRLIHRASDHDERARHHRARRIQPALISVLEAA